MFRGLESLSPRSVRRDSPVEPPRPEPKAVAPGETDSFEPASTSSDPAPAPTEAAVSATPSTNGGSVTAGVSGTAGPATVGVNVTLEANLDEKVEREDGYVTVTVSAEASVTAEGELALDGKKIGASVSGSVTEGTNATYELRLTEADYEKLKAGELDLPNPLDPATIPDGATVRLDQAQFEGTAFESTIAYHGAELGLSSSGSESEGTSLQLTRDGDSLQVTAGPTEVLSASAGASVTVGPVTVSAGNTTEVSSFQLRTAEFDLGSAEGQEAYQRYANTGELPPNGPGVTHAGRVEQVDYSSDSSLGVEAAGLSLDLPTGATGGSRTSFYGDDGTAVHDVTLDYGGPTLEMHTEYNEYGRQYDQDQYTFTFDDLDPASRGSLVEAFTGDFERGQAATETEGPITVELDLHQLARLRNQVRQDYEENGSSSNLLDVLHASDGSNDEFALALAKYFSGEDAIASELHMFAGQLGSGDDFADLPGSVDEG